MSGHVTAQHKFYLVLTRGKRAELQSCLKDIWRSQTSPLLGHNMGPLRSYELPHKVQKLMGGLGASSPRKFRNFTASQVGSEVIYCSEV